MANGVIVPNVSFDMAFISGNAPTSLDTFYKIGDYPAGFNYNNTVVVGKVDFYGDGWGRTISDKRISVLTGSDGVYVVVNSSEAGASSFLGKPVIVAIAHKK